MSDYSRSVLSASGRRLRVTATVLVMAALLAGARWGDDDHFPFGPMRMYSTTNEPNGKINHVKIEGVTAAGERIDIPTREFGLRPAEINGQITRWEDDSQLMPHLMTAYRRFNPDGPRLIELRLLHGLHYLRGGRPVAYSMRLLAVWTQS